MSLQTMTLTLDGITAGDYLTWCRDPDPIALDFALRSIRIDANPLDHTITVVLDWNQPPPPAQAAGLPLSTGVHLEAVRPVDLPQKSVRSSAKGGAHPTLGRRPAPTSLSLETTRARDAEARRGLSPDPGRIRIAH